jgi:hypothetical protein
MRIIAEAPERALAEQWIARVQAVVDASLKA